MAERRVRTPGRERPGLSRAQIVQTALAIIDRDGVSGLSMRKLGAELGVDAMAVYYHLPNKSALFDGVIDAVYADARLADMPRTGTWREQVTEFMHRLRAAIRRHPNALPVVATRPAYVPSMLDFGDYALGVAVAAGFPAADAIDMVNCLATYTIGHVLAELGEPVGGDTLATEEVTALLTAGTYPNLARAFSEGYDYRPDHQYTLGLEAMLDGFERRLRTSKRRPAGSERGVKG
jgi:AcrR family transcriptional regulator